jgi:hypothetical protein
LFLCFWTPLPSFLHGKWVLVRMESVASWRWRSSTLNTYWYLLWASLNSHHVFIWTPLVRGYCNCYLQTGIRESRLVQAAYRHMHIYIYIYIYAYCRYILSSCKHYCPIRLHLRNISSTLKLLGISRWKQQDIKPTWGAFWVLALWNCSDHIPWSTYS